MCHPSKKRFELGKHLLDLPFKGSDLLTGIFQVLGARLLFKFESRLRDSGCATLRGRTLHGVGHALQKSRLVRFPGFPNSCQILGALFCEEPEQFVQKVPVSFDVAERRSDIHTTGRCRFA